jgi:mono/diheme cytochrome c family protein
MPQVYQYSSLNMGWCVSCHVNGYSPQEGEVAAGYARIDSGTITPAGAPEQPSAAASANAQQLPSSSTLAVGRQPAKNAAGRSVARYDCANCHY